MSTIAPAPPLGRVSILVMAAACGLAVANIYYNQPMLVDIAHRFDLPGEAAGTIPAATQLGYLLGMLFLVPLGDRLPRRPLILAMLSGLVLALAGAALAPSLSVLAVASLAVGMLSTIAQQIVPMAAHLAAPEKRGSVVGTVMAGLLIGILGARTLAGSVAEYFGWRAMFWLAAGLMILLGLVLARLLPTTRPTSSLSYPALLRSLWTLFRREPVLREAAFEGALLFGVFSAFWATLTLLLASPNFGLGPQVAGLFGLLGIAGALVAPLAGRLADRGGPRRTIGLGIGLTLAGFLCFAASAHRLIGLIIGVVLLDAGVQAAQISNQSRIYALGEESRSRVNTVYMVGYFAGGAAGSTLGALAWSLGGWAAVSALGIIAMLAALGVHWRGRAR